MMAQVFAHRVRGGGRPASMPFGSTLIASLAALARPRNFRGFFVSLERE